jgi:integrase/recombinase XerD
VGEITQKDINDYIIFIKTAHGVGYAKCRSVAHACAFFYKKVIDMPYILPKTLYPRKQFILPKVMNRVEVKLLFKANTDPFTRSVISLLYGSGLRIGEVKSLKLADIKSVEKVLHISQSKGNKDRRTLLSEKQIFQLRAYWQSLRVKPKIYLYESPQSRKPYHERSLQLVVTQANPRAESLLAVAAGQAKNLSLRITADTKALPRAKLTAGGYPSDEASRTRRQRLYFTYTAPFLRYAYARQRCRHSYDQRAIGS